MLRHDAPRLRRLGAPPGRADSAAVVPPPSLYAPASMFRAPLPLLAWGASPALRLLLAPAVRHATLPAYMMFTRDSASCADTAAVQPPGRRLPSVCAHVWVAQAGVPGGRMQPQCMMIGVMCVGLG